MTGVFALPPSHCNAIHWLHNSPLPWVIPTEYWQLLKPTPYTAYNTQKSLYCKEVAHVVIYFSCTEQKHHTLCNCVPITIAISTYLFVQYAILVYEYTMLIKSKSGVINIDSWVVDNCLGWAQNESHWVWQLCRLIWAKQPSWSGLYTMYLQIPMCMMVGHIHLQCWLRCWKAKIEGQIIVVQASHGKPRGPPALLVPNRWELCETQFPII